MAHAHALVRGCRPLHLENRLQVMSVTFFRKAEYASLMLGQAPDAEHPPMLHPFYADSPEDVLELPELLEVAEITVSIPEGLQVLEALQGGDAVRYGVQRSSLGAVQA